MDQRQQHLPAREPPDPSPDPWRVAGMAQPRQMLAAAIGRGEFQRMSRRMFVSATMLGLAACASGTQAQRASRELPKGAWLEPPARPSVPAVASAEPATAPAAPPKPVQSPRPASAKREFNPVGEAALPWAKPRFLWAKGAPIRGQLNPMLPVTCVTVHHDGLDELFWSTRPADVSARLEHYRVGHLARGWADIGYHLAIDRGGTLWQGRAIRWQGAHVQNHNEGNIGVLVMGNFDLQKPTFAQLRTLDRVIRELRATYGIKRGRVYTHKEWPDAQTACPGRTLQPRVTEIRRTVGA